MLYRPVLSVLLYLLNVIDHISYKLEFILEETRTSVAIIVINDHSSDDPDGIFSALKV